MYGLNPWGGMDWMQGYQEQPQAPQAAASPTYSQPYSNDQISQMLTGLIKDRMNPQGQGIFGNSFLPKALLGGIAGYAGSLPGPGWGAIKGLSAAAYSGLKDKDPDENYDRKVQALKLMQMANEMKTPKMVTPDGYAPMYQYPDGTMKPVDTSQWPKKLPDPPSGFQYGPDNQGLHYTPGGPADPAYMRTRPDRANVPPGYLPDPNDPTKLVVQEGGPATKLPENAAAAVGMMKASQKEMKQIGAEKILLETPAFTADLQGYWKAGSFGRAQRSLREGVEAALRMTTGATAPPEEVARYADMYIPEGTDSKQTREQKLRMARDLFAQAENMIMRGHEAPSNKEAADPLGIR